MSAPAIALRDVGKVFVRDDGGAVAVLEHVGLEIAAGSFVCLVGRSGSGKSTILNMIAGLIGPTSGEIAFADGSTKRPRLDIGYLTQKETLLPWRDVIRNVAMPLEVRGIEKSRREAIALDLIRVVGLAGAERRYPRELSGGMARRASLARMLASDPAILLLDEPFGALDAQLRSELQHELLRCGRAAGRRSSSSRTISTKRWCSPTGSSCCSRAAGSRSTSSCRSARPRDVRDVRFAPEFVALHERLLEASERSALAGQ